MFVLIVSYLLIVFVVPIALSLIVSFRALPMGRRCVQCGSETIRIRARHLNALSVNRAGFDLHRRWCSGCGWEGVTRVPVEHASHAHLTSPAGADKRATTQTLDVRSVIVDGRPFRVMLQCWHQTGYYYGRFVFVGPSGRLWLDAVEAFSGSNQTEILGQALSLPQGLLEHRLRRLVTEP